jgi:hypothetical protein
MIDKKMYEKASIISACVAEAIERVSVLDFGNGMGC